MPISGPDPDLTQAITQQFSKPVIFQRMDQASLTQTAASLKAIRDKVGSAKDLVDLGDELGLIVGPEEILHIRDHWFDESGGGWFKRALPGIEIKGRIRAGFREVLRLLRQNPRPLDMFLQVIPSPPGGGFSFSHLLVPGRLVVILTVPQPQLPAGASVTVDYDDVVFITAQFDNVIDTRPGKVGVGITLASAQGVPSSKSKPGTPRGKGKKTR